MRIFHLYTLWQCKITIAICFSSIEKYLQKANSWRVSRESQILQWHLNCFLFTNTWQIKEIKWTRPCKLPFVEISVALAALPKNPCKAGIFLNQTFKMFCFADIFLNKTSSLSFLNCPLSECISVCPGLWSWQDTPLST